MGADVTGEVPGPPSWDWDAVREHLLKSAARTARDPRNVVVVTGLESSGTSETTVAYVDRRNGARYRETFDLAGCVTAYDATSVEQLVGAVYADLEEAVLSVRPAGTPTAEGT